MRKAYRVLMAILEAYSGILILAMLGVVLLGVFFRYIVDQALSWYDEFASYILVWLTMYGSVVGLAQGKHIGFEAVTENFPPRVRRATEIFALVCIFGFSMVLVGAGLVLIRAMASETAISIPEIKMAWIYSVLPISGGLMALVSLVQLVGMFVGKDSSGRPRFTGLEEGQ